MIGFKARLKEEAHMSLGADLQLVGTSFTKDLTKADQEIPVQRESSRFLLGMDGCRVFWALHTVFIPFFRTNQPFFGLQSFLKPKS